MNNFELGQHGRYRTNVWDYAGISSLSSTRDDDLAMHPTVKPVAMIADAIMDVTYRGDIVLDSFGGSGSTLIAAHESGRIARVIELDSAYCDVIIQRWQRLTGDQARLAGTDEPFDEMRRARHLSGSVAQQPEVAS
jgi:DNA modification methylase